MNNGLLRALSGSDEDREAYINAEVLRAAVMRSITCPRSGAVLDIRTAVYFRVELAGKAAAECVTGAVWDAIREPLTARCAELDASLEVIDGRTLH